MENKKAQLVVIAHDVDPIEVSMLQATRVTEAGSEVLSRQKWILRQIT